MDSTSHPSSDAWSLRYREGATAPIALNDTIATILAHRSVRRYAPKPLPPGTLETLIAAAQSAATSSNQQWISVVSIDDRTIRDRLATLASNQEHIRVAPMFLVWLADLSRAERIGQAHATELPGVDYLETFVVATIDAALAAQNAVIAAESLGLGTVYIGAIRNHPEDVAKELGLPPRVMPLFGLCVGWEDRSDPRKVAAVKPRLAQEMVLHRDQYSTEAEAGALARYEEVFARFQEEQGLPAAGWSARLIDRLKSAASLGGRERLREVMRAMGFSLR